MKKVIVFDLDGVLFDSTALVSKFFLDTFPTLTKSALDEMLAGNFHDEVEKFKKNNKSIDETEHQRTLRDQKYSKEKVNAPLFAGVEGLLRDLRAAGATLAINTAAAKVNCVPLLEKAGISSWFDFIATKDLSTDKAEKLRLISERYSVPAGEMVFVTDTLGDLRDAARAGVPTVAVTYGAHDRSFFERERYANLVKIAGSVKELEGYLLGR